jgi:hypothetical protein
VNSEQKERMRQGRLAAQQRKAQERSKGKENPFVPNERQTYTLKGAGDKDGSGKQMVSLLLKAYAGTATAQQVVFAKCGECCLFDRSAIRLCGITSCPCWFRRPYHGRKTTP